MVVYEYPVHLAALLYFSQALLNTLGVLAYFVFAGLFFNMRNPTKWKHLTLVLVFLAADCGLLSILLGGFANLPFLYRVLISTITRSLYVLALFKCPYLSFKRLSAITLSFSVSGVNVLMESLFLTAFVTLDGGSTQWAPMFVLGYSAKAMLFLLCVLIRRLRDKVSIDTIRKSINLLFGSYLILIFAIALWFGSSGQTHFWVALLVLYAVISILVIVLVYESAGKKHEQEQAKLLSLQNELMTARLESDKRLMDAVHQTRHDLEKHLDYIHSLLTEARTDEAQRYIQQIAKPVKAEAPPIRTGCPAIDTVLQIERRKASAQGITMELVAHGLPESCIAPADANCILGNLLDNAIEAQAGVAEEERYVQVSLRQKHDFLMIHIKNTVTENPLQNNGKLRTTKKEQRHLHGIGLKSVETAVKRYAGELSFDFESGWFTVSVLLCAI